MLEILKQIAMYNLVKQSGYTQVVALSIFHLCFPKKQVLILITKAENKSKCSLCLSLVAFVSSFFPVFLWLLTVPDFKSSSSVSDAGRLPAIPAFCPPQPGGCSRCFPCPWMCPGLPAAGACSGNHSLRPQPETWCVICTSLCYCHVSSALLVEDNFFTLLMLEIVHDF